MSNTRLIIFAKLPRLGQVKTRLQGLLGAEGCLALHYALITHSLDLARNWDQGPVELWFSERPSKSELDGLQQLLDVPKFVTVCFQQGRNLGERMQYALQSSADQGDAAVLIGTDCPGQINVHLSQASSLLRSDVEVVVQPALDGGFVLIACSDKAPDLSGDIDWGTAKVLTQLEIELEKQQLSIGKIEIISDLDEEEDFLLLQQDDKAFLSKFYKWQKSLKKS